LCIGWNSVAWSVCCLNWDLRSNKLLCSNNVFNDLRLLNCLDYLWCGCNNSASSNRLLNNLCNRLLNNGLSCCCLLSFNLNDLFFTWCVNYLFLNSLIFTSFLDSVLWKIVNKFISVDIWDMFSLIFNSPIIGLFLFMRNILNFIDLVILSECFFERNIFDSRSTTLNLMNWIFDLNCANTLISFNYSINLARLLNNLWNTNLRNVLSYYYLACWDDCLEWSLNNLRL